MAKVNVIHVPSRSHPDFNPQSKWEGGTFFWARQFSTGGSFGRREGRNFLAMLDARLAEARVKLTGDANKRIVP